MASLILSFLAAPLRCEDTNVACLYRNTDIFSIWKREPEVVTEKDKQGGNAGGVHARGLEMLIRLSS